jgi:fatty acid desaturase
MPQLAMAATMAASPADPAQDAKPLLEPHAAEAAAIRKAIVQEERRLRKAYPVLERQDELGFGLWMASLTVMVLVAGAYARGSLPWWLTVPLVALPLSVLHELEHDTIHDMYFMHSPWLQNIMFFGIWVAKLSMSPWVRRDLHLLHHKRSGQVDDIEERLLGLGVRSTPLRVAAAFMPWLGFLWVRSIQKDHGSWRLLRGTPCSLTRWIQRVDLVFIASPLLMTVLAVRGSALAHMLLVTWVAPNVWRHACIALMSSYSHYYGDVNPRDVTEQNQILRHWSLWPLQAFCCNFGAEHIIHHYTVGQPFYLRHMVRHTAWTAMLANGVRQNDWGTVERANRRGPWPAGGRGAAANGGSPKATKAA